MSEHQEAGRKPRNPVTARIRAVIGHIPGAWVRVWRNGEIWAGNNAERTTSAMLIVRDALQAAGYRCECNGEHHTAGAFIIDVFPPTE